MSEFSDSLPLVYSNSMKTARMLHVETIKKYNLDRKNEEQR